MALFFQRCYNYLGVKSSKIEDIEQGTLSLRVKDGVLNLKALKKARVTKQELYAMLREKKVQNMAKVKRAYFKACGVLSVFESEEKKPGLPIFPKRDPAIIPELQQQVDHGIMACSSCGHVQQVPDMKTTHCEVCNQTAWIDAFVEKEQ